MLKINLKKSYHPFFWARSTIIVGVVSVSFHFTVSVLDLLAPVITHCSRVFIFVTFIWSSAIACSTISRFWFPTARFGGGGGGCVDRPQLATQNATLCTWARQDGTDIGLPLFSFRLVALCNLNQNWTWGHMCTCKIMYVLNCRVLIAYSVQKLTWKGLGKRLATLELTHNYTP